MSSKKIFVIVVSGILLVCVLGAAVVLGIFMSGGNNLADFPKIFGNNINVDEQITLDLEGVNTIQIECASSNINIIKSDTPSVALKGTLISSSPREKYLTVTKQDGILNIKVDYYPNIFNISDLALSVYMPGSSSLSASIDSSSGNINISDMQFDRINVSHTSGNMHVTNCTASAFSSKGSSGDTNITSCSFGSTDYTCTSGNVTIESTSGSISVSATSGNIALSGVSGAIAANCVSGNITVDMSVIAPVTAGVTSGSINIFVPKNAAFNLTAKVTSGNISSDLYIEVTGSLSGFDRNNISGTCNGGGVPLYLSAISGNINIYGN